MGMLDFFQSDHEEVQSGNTGSLTHDALAAAVAWQAAKAYEEHCEANGQPQDHATAKKVLASLAAAGAMRLAETKGRDLWDQHNRDSVVEKAREQLDVKYEEDRLQNQY